MNIVLFITMIYLFLNFVYIEFATDAYFKIFDMKRPNRLENITNYSFNVLINGFLVYLIIFVFRLISVSGASPNDNNIHIIHLFVSIDSFILKNTIMMITIIMITLLCSYFLFFSEYIDRYNMNQENDIERHFEFIDLLVPFCSRYLINHLFSNNVKNAKNVIDYVPFETDIDNKEITDKKSLKLLTKINEDLIPKYNEIDKMIEENKELDFDYEKDLEKIKKDIKEKILDQVDKIAENERLDDKKDFERKMKNIQKSLND